MRLEFAAQSEIGRREKNEDSIAAERTLGLFRNVLSRALGVGDEIRCDILATPVEKGDTFLLCTDGLSDYLDAMLGILDTEADPSKACRALTGAAFENGSTDNVTAIVVMVGGG